MSRLVPISACFLLLSVPLIAAEPAAERREKIPVILDTDFGTDVDDAFALALVLASPELDLLGVTTVNEDARARAMIACRFLHSVDRAEVPVAAGTTTSNVSYGQYQYGRRPARKHPVKESAVEFLYQQLKQRPGEITLITVGDLSNLADLITKHPDCKPWIKRVVMMAGSVRVGYNNRPPAQLEWNVRQNIDAARTVFASGLPLVVAPLDATTSLHLQEPQLQQLWQAHTLLTDNLRGLHQLWENYLPTLYDPMAVALVFDESFCKLEKLRIEVDEQGITREVPGEPNARVATSVDREAFLKWYVERLTRNAQPRQLPEPRNIATLIPRGNLPPKVHVIEDYETDIEQRWWLAGRLETKNVPPGSQRACRGVITQNFDDPGADPLRTHTAVIFNPVPGPPMGPRTRLSFRYWLKGTDTLRVQIYSLSNGYHRFLTLTGLPQERWDSGTVDMTLCRREDGSGGPLSADERIDDIQFYVSPDAELLIDDIVLYEAAAEEEQRPFPTRPIFCGWFDTGVQGKEWPGEFEIVLHKPPLTWDAAKSVINKETGQPWLRVSMRGARPIGRHTQLRFRYHLTGSEELKVSLQTAADPPQLIVRELDKVTQGAWQEVILDFSDADRPAGTQATHIRFDLPADAELLVDDLLLFEQSQTN